MAHEETDAQVLNSIDSESTNPIPVIYQSGYLTIKGYDERFGIYRLGFPNREVEEGFIRFLLPFYANVNKVESGVRAIYLPPDRLWSAPTNAANTLTNKKQSSGSKH